MSKKMNVEENVKVETVETETVDTKAEVVETEKVSVTDKVLKKVGLQRIPKPETEEKSKKSFIKKTAKVGGLLLAGIGIAGAAVKVFGGSGNTVETETVDDINTEDTEE